MNDRSNDRSENEEADRLPCKQFRDLFSRLSNLLLKKNPADEMGWNVREVHQEQVQVGTAGQAAYVQQETIINHADNHPM